MSLVDQVRDAGIIGAGGAGFPTHVKLNSEAEYILLNGAECEPLLRVDQQLMAMYPREIIQGFEMAGRQVNAKKAIIGIKGKHADVIEILEKTIAELGVGDYVSIGVLPDIYPAGDEQVLVYELTGRTVPETGIPIMCGCVVLNSETAMNVYMATQGQAVTETWITLAGDIPERKTFKVPVGTPVMDVLRQSGIDDFSEYEIIDGGPMMGPILADRNGYIVKKNKGFVILKKDHPLIQKKSCTMEQARRVNRATCEQCRMCTDLCPRFLIGHDMQPHKTMRILNYGLEDIEGKKMGQLCCQCNLCEYFSCPANLHPRLTNLMFRDELMAQKIKFEPDKDKEYKARDARSYRLVPSKRLIARLGLKKFDQPAPVVTDPVQPAEVRIQLGQHVGAPCTPIVKTGDNVSAGQMIGQIPEKALGAPVHASVSGQVTEVTDKYIAIRRV